MSQIIVSKQIRPICESTIVSQNESEFVRDRRSAGDRIIKKNGQYWCEIRPGFFQSVHWLARMPASSVIRPKLFCWGYRATLAEEDTKLANGSMPVNLLKDISQYNIEYLCRRSRRALLKSFKLVTVVELTGPELLIAEGYKVFSSAWARTKYGPKLTKNAYEVSIRFPYTTKSIILAGLIDGKLGGYLEGHAIGKTAYFQKLVFATEYLSTQIGSVLVHNFVQICRRSKDIQEVVYGQHSREDLNLTEFKERMGFPVVHIPAIVCINSFAEKILRKYKPHVYYRLTGHE